MRQFRFSTRPGNAYKFGFVVRGELESEGIVHFVRGILITLVLGIPLLAYVPGRMLTPAVIEHLQGDHDA